MQQNKSINDVSTTDKRLLALKDAHGPVLFNMTNDYLFRAVLQTNHNVLKGLVCSLLHLDEQDIISASSTLTYSPNTPNSTPHTSS